MKLNLVNFTILTLLVVCNSFPAQTTQDGVWGEWTSTFSPSNTSFFMCGAELRYERPQGQGDDSAVNGLKVVFCSSNDWNRQEVRQFDGILGDWKGRVMCPKNSFVDAFQAQVEQPQGQGDDTALNGLKIRCLNPQTNQNIVLTVYEGYWGTWRDWKYATPSTEAKNRSLFSSFAVKSERAQGRGDDTAMNGISLIPSIYGPLSNSVHHMRKQYD